MMKEEDEIEAQPLRIIGTPKYENGKYVFADNIFAILNRECGWICPRCYNEVRICPTKAGEQTFKCTNKHCSATFVVRVDADAVTFMPEKKKKPAGAAASVSAGAVGVAAAGAAAAIAVQQKVQGPARGMLLMPEDDDTPKKPITPAVNKPEQPKVQVIEKPVVADDDDNETVIVQKPSSTPSNASQQESTGTLQWGGFFSRKHFKLRVGSNVIGRKDNKTPSDLEFDDPEMSRRSVKIDAIPNGQGSYTFTLSVLKALNPVKVNDQQVIQGTSTTLKHNDTITMGKTTLTFKCS